MRPKDSAPLREAAAEPTPEPGPVRYRVEFRQDDLALSVQSVEEGSAPEVPAGAEHARLIGWTSGDGRPADPYSPVTGDTVYRAVFETKDGWREIVRPALGSEKKIILEGMLLVNEGDEVRTKDDSL